MTAFGDELLRLRLLSGRSGSSVAHASGMDASYLSRLEKGEREPPRREFVLSISRELHLSDDDRDRLLTLAGHTTPLIDSASALAASNAEFRQVLAVLVDRPVVARTLLAMVQAWPRKDAE